MSNFILKDATPDDTPSARQLAVDTRMFEEAESHEVEQQLLAVINGEAPGSVITAHDGESVVGSAYVAPEPFSDRCWNLYFLVVDPQQHSNGVGSLLVAEVEQRLRALGSDVARVLLIETSSTDQYNATRAFYRGRGYVEEAIIRDFYGPDDNKVVFWKGLLPGM